MKSTLKVTSKGQVTLRKVLLDHLGVQPGDEITVEMLPCGKAELRATRAQATIDDFVGCLKQPGTAALSIEQIKEIAARGWAGER